MSLEKPDFNSFESTVEALFSRVRGHIEPGAHRIQKLTGNDRLSALTKIPAILVGGTNGKGTACALLEKTFRLRGYKTALYTSPHLVSPTERIRLCGRPVSKSLFLKYCRLVFEDAQEHLPDATFFELMTAIAFHYFADSGPDVFVCEVGLGGRLDSTNVLSPLVSVLTSIGLDHTEWLGPDEFTIGFEKSFISRRNRPLITGAVSSQAFAGISKGTSITGARIISPRETLLSGHPDIAPEAAALAAEAALQLSAMESFGISEADIAEAAAQCHWPGRFDLRKVQGCPVLLDAAHNPDGIAFFLRESANRPLLRALPKPKIVVYASLADKDWKKCLEMLIPEATVLILTQTQSPRAVPAEVLINYIRSKRPESECIGFDLSSEALDHALRVSASGNGSISVLGSLTLIGEALEHFRLPVFSEFDSGDSCTVKS
ncbi:MAG: hypothetical protein EBR09_01820 [Proteobacteria bacterium]|nr:hypothetical protein [Pseudomonadota bacterium]